MKLGERSHLGKARIVVGLILGTITSNLWQPLVCAQITPDNTLGTESSVINSNVELNEKLVELIEGGAIRDANLFHSFEQFNLAEGQNVYFANPAGISNILTRVTGKDASNIFGTLGVNGTANLFLLNPNGIVFGENARLDVAGSFVGSTANGIAFENGFSFSSVFPEAVPLLRINIPVGLQYGANPGRIIVQGDGQGLRATTDLIDTLTGLRVPPNQTLALVGGEMELSGGTLKTAGGRIELGSITQSGLVTLTPIAQGWVLGYDGIKNFGDIELSQQAAVDASGTGGGDIQVRGRRVSLSDGSQIEGATLGSEAGGSLTVNATESVQVIGRSADGEFPSGLGTQSAPGSTGNTGDLTISTPTLLIQDGAEVSANTFASGAGGNLTVNATESVQVIGESDDGEFGSNLIAQAEPGSTGNAGDLTISTSTLLISDGAQVSASTFAEGAGGNLTVNATESVQVIGTSADGRFSSGLFAGTLGTGDAGDLTISTPELLIQDGAGVSAGTFAEGAGGNLTVNATESVQMIGNSADGQISSLNALAQGTGNAGNLTISTPELLIQDGAQVATATVGEGDGGSLMVNATESVQLMGTSSDGQFSSGLFVQTNGKGNAGNLNITTEQLSIQDEAVVSARSLGEGNSGDIEIQAGSLSLDNQGTITGTTRTGDGGNITIKDLDLLLLRRGSQISTTAGTAESGGDGGDINIAADLIVAIPQENSDITANAFTGQGGNVQITAQGIFGIKFRPAETSLSDITASSEFGLSGTVVLNIPDVDVLSGLVKLPEQLISVQPWEGCRTTTAQSSSFVRTGKGGLPSNPDRLLESTHVLDDLSLPQGWSEAASEIPNKIVEATSWIVNEEGAVELIAHKPNCLQSQS